MLIGASSGYPSTSSPKETLPPPVLKLTGFCRMATKPRTRPIVAKTIPGEAFVSFAPTECGASNAQLKIRSSPERSSKHRCLSKRAQDKGLPSAGHIYAACAVHAP